MMDNQCYYCEQIFTSKEKLYEHLEVHSEPESEQKIKRKKERIRKQGESSLSNDEILEQFNDVKSGESSRMTQKSD